MYRRSLATVRPSLSPSAVRDAATERELLPARVSVRFTFVLAAILTPLVTFMDVVGSGPTLGFYWLTTIGLGVLSFWRRPSERALAVLSCVSWMLTGIATIAMQGLAGGATIMLAGIALVGLFFGTRLALLSTALATAAMAASGYAHVVGLIRVVGPAALATESAAFWASATATFSASAMMTALVQSAVLRRAATAGERARHFALAVERTESSVIITDVERRITWTNEAFSRLTGYTHAEASGKRPAELLQGSATSSSDIAFMRERIRAGEAFTREVVNYTKAREPYWTSVEVHALVDGAGRVTGYTGVQTDVTAVRVRTELDALERSLAAALADARTEEEGFGALARGLAGISLVLGATAWRWTAASSTLVARALTSEPRFASADLDASCPQDGPVTKKLRSGVAFGRCDDVPIPHAVLARRVGTDRAALLEVHVADDMPGRAELAERLPRLVSSFESFARRLEANARFEAIFDHAPDALVLVDEAGIVRQRNPSAQQLFGGLEVGAHAADALGELSGEVADVLAERGSLKEPRELIWEQTSHGSHWRDLEAGVVPITLASGPGLLVSVRDVTARRQAEHALERALVDVRSSLAEREVLLKEIHHRVKNNLQIVASLLGMQADRAQTDEGRDVLIESEQRVRSMAIIHRLLYSGRNLAHVDMGSYAQTLAAELRAALDPRAEFRIDADAVELPVDQAIPCGLVMNELITNALKHGRSEDGNTRLSVSVASKAGDVLVVVEDGGRGFPEGYDPMRTSSLGMKIVDALVRQLGAQLEISSPAGARFALRIPSAVGARTDGRRASRPPSA